MESVIKEIQSVILDCERNFDVNTIRQFQESIDSFSSLVSIGKAHYRGFNIQSVDELRVYNSINLIRNSNGE